MVAGIRRGERGCSRLDAESPETLVHGMGPIAAGVLPRFPRNRRSRQWRLRTNNARNSTRSNDNLGLSKESSNEPREEPRERVAYGRTNVEVKVDRCTFRGTAPGGQLQGDSSRGTAPGGYLKVDTLRYIPVNTRWCHMCSRRVCLVVHDQTRAFPCHVPCHVPCSMLLAAVTSCTDRGMSFVLPCLALATRPPGRMWRGDKPEADDSPYARAPAA